MAKTSGTPAELGPTTTKAAVLAKWFADKPHGLKFKDVQDEIKKVIEKAGHTFNPSSDYQQFLIAGRKAGKLPESKKEAEGTKSTKTSFAAFAKAIADKKIENDAIMAAIDIVAKCGTTEEARTYANRWALIVKTVGSTDKALEVINLMG